MLFNVSLRLVHQHLLRNGSDSCNCILIRPCAQDVELCNHFLYDVSYEQFEFCLH